VFGCCLQSSRAGRSNHLAVKPPRPPIKQCRSPPSEDANDYDNVAATFSFPVRASPSDDQHRWMVASERSPSFQRWIPAQRQRSAGTSSSKGLYRLHQAPPWRVSVPTDDGMAVHGDLSVCIGLTVQCSQMPATAVHTSSAPSYVIDKGHHRGPAPRGYGASAVERGAVEPWRSSPPTRLVPVHSYHDDHVTSSCPPRRQTGPGPGQSDRFRAKFPRDLYRSHPVAGPQCEVGHDFHIPRRPFTAAAWQTPTSAGPPSRRSFEDFAVGFDSTATSFVSGDVADQAGFLDDGNEDEAAFDEITQQIASLTQTVNELRSKHRRPNVDNSVRTAWNTATLRTAAATTSGNHRRRR